MTRSAWIFLAAFAVALAAVFFLSPRPVPEKVSVPLPVPIAPAPPPDPILPTRGSETPHARIAIIIDDFGVNRARVDRFFALPNRLTAAVIPHLPRSAEIAGRAHELGFDVFLHQPMEPRAYPAENPGKHGLYVMQSPEEVAMILDDNIRSLGVPLTGVNNHMGSKATESPELMSAFFDALPRGLIFVDSRTSETSVAFSIARERGFTALKNNVFLDAAMDSVSVDLAFDQLIRHAKKRGAAVGIGHIQSEETILLLERRLPTIESEGVRLVRVGDLLKPSEVE